MTNRIKAAIIFLLAMIVVVIPQSASAFTPAPRSEDGFSYFDGSTVTNLTTGTEMTLGKFILEWTGDDAVLEIPAELGGVKMEVLSSGAVKDRDTLTAVILPASAMEIMSAAFKNCPNLEKAVIHDELQINSNPFVKCPALQEFVLDENAKRYGLVEGNLYNLETMSLLTAFPNESGTYVVPEGTLRIAGMAYSNVKDIVSIDLPEGLSQIGFYAFEACENLQEIRLPDTLTSIELGAFWECRSLGELVLPESLECIKNAVFVRCENLKTVYIPASVSEIGSTAFSECPNLQLIVEKDSYAEKWANENEVAYMYAYE